MQTKKTLPRSKNRSLLMLVLALAGITCHFTTTAKAQSYADFSNAVIIVDSDGTEPVLENTARVLAEEVEKRTGIQWRKVNRAPRSGAHVIIRLAKPGELAPEGYRITLDERRGGARLVIESADVRASLYGAGHILRKSNWNKGRFLVPAAIETETDRKSVV